LAEALMRAARIPAGFLREHFGLECLPDFDEARWRRLRADADGRIRPLPGSLSGSDVDAEMITHARANLSRLPYGEDVELRAADFRSLPECPGAIVLCNPPYGRRLGDRKEVQGLLRAMGDVLKRRCPHGTAWIYVGDRELAKSIGLRASMRKPLRNGGLDGRLLRYDLYPRSASTAGSDAPRDENASAG
jgi:putative N6-adenine-specific DNA methylase